MAGLAVVCALLVGCSSGPAVTIQHAGTPDATLDPVLPTALAGVQTPLVLQSPPAPAAEIRGLRLTRPGGTDVALGDLRGSRGTVVAFWASYCIPCRDELPALQRREPALRRQGVTLVLADAGRESQSAAEGFLRDHGVTLPWFVDTEAAVHDAIGLIGVPTTAVLGADGGVRDRLEGAADLGPLDGALAAMGISAQ